MEAYTDRYMCTAYRGRPSRKAFDFSEDEIADLPLAAGSSRNGSSFAGSLSATRCHLSRRYWNQVLTSNSNGLEDANPVISQNRPQNGAVRLSLGF